MIKTVSVMPSLGNRRRHSNHVIEDVANHSNVDNPVSSAAAHAVMRCVGQMERDGIDLILDQVELQVRFG